MDRLKLVLPTAADEQAIWDYREEFFNNNDQHLDGTGGLANVQDFAGWYRKNLAYRSEETTPPDKVPAFTYLAVLEQTVELIGMIDIRHRLNEGLLKLGVDRVLLTCDKTNIGSAKTIQHNGGVLENEIETPDRITQRYWIKL